MVSATLWQPLVAIIGLPVLVGFFGACALWFVVLGVRGFRVGQRRARTHGWHAFGHAGMFGAMTWHLAAMLAHGGGGMDHASHGMAMTLWLTATVRLADPGGFWAGLRLPDVFTVDVTGSSIKRVEGEGALPLQIITREEIVRTGVGNAYDAIVQLRPG